MDSQQGPIVKYMELCSMLCASLDGRRIWGRMDTCIPIADFLHCSPETITTLLIVYTPIQNKKFRVWGKKKEKQNHGFHWFQVTRKTNHKTVTNMDNNLLLRL